MDGRLIVFLRQDQKIHVYELKDRKAKLKILIIHVVNLKDSESVKNHELSLRSRLLSMCNNADVQPIVDNPVDDDKIPAETRARMFPAPREPSKIEKTKHELKHIPFLPQWAPRVKSKAKAEPHKRVEFSAKTAKFPLFNVTDGLKVLSMYVKSFGCGTSTAVETTSETDTFAVMWV